MRVEVTLKKDRSKLGSLKAFDGSGALVLGPVDCLGEADAHDAALHGNANRVTTLAFGHTPTGDYKIVQLVSHMASESDLHTFGTYPSILLDPSSGDALKAKQNGRAGLMIHGGAPSLTGGLRPTHGCVRLSEAHQRDLVSMVVHASLNQSSVTVSEE